MAGSYKHIVDDKGRLLDNDDFVGMIENLGDAYEMAEQLYGMVWWLAKGDKHEVEEAKRFYKNGLDLSPGVKAGEEA